MPFSEVESHPFLRIGESIPAKRMIVGTFPVYSITRPGTTLKSQLRQQNNNIPFFYGSSANWFWTWYQQYVDNTINAKCNKSILVSLQVNGIAISDVISSCTRNEYSFEDSDLRKKKWNISLVNLIESDIDKIICTSKSDSGAMGWLRDRILVPHGFRLNQSSSLQLHKQILGQIPNSNQRVKPIAQVLIKNNREISLVAVPSPGSPYRRLTNFGYDKRVHNSTIYLDNFLTQVFNWF